MADERIVTFHPLQPGWWFHHYEGRSHQLTSYPVLGFESVSFPYAPDPGTAPTTDPRRIEARLDYVGNDSIVAVVMTGRPGEVTFRFRTEDDLGAIEGRTENWLGLYPGKSRDELLDHFSEDIDAMRESLRKEHEAAKKEDGDETPGAGG